MTQINKGLSDYTRGRRVAALVDIERTKAMLRREMITGEIKRRCDAGGNFNLNHMDVSILAQRHWNFLNGPKHKKSTKVDVENFLDSLHKDFEKKYGSKSVLHGTPEGGKTYLPTELDLVKAELETVKLKLAALKDRHDRVSSYINQWALELRSARAEIRLLRAERTPTVVPLPLVKKKPRTDH